MSITFEAGAVHIDGITFNSFEEMLSYARENHPYWFEEKEDEIIFRSNHLTLSQEDLTKRRCKKSK